MREFSWNADTAAPVEVSKGYVALTAEIATWEHRLKTWRTLRDEPGIRLWIQRAEFEIRSLEGERDAFVVI